MAKAGVSRPLKPEGPLFALYRSHSKCFRVIRTQGADVRCLMFSSCRSGSDKPNKSRHRNYLPSPRFKGQQNSSDRGAW